MTDYQIGSAVFIALVACMFIPRALQRRRVRKELTAASLAHLGDELTRVTGQRDRWMARSERYENDYLAALRRIAALEEFIGDQREEVERSLADQPAYFDAKAAREAASLDYELFDLLGGEGS